MPGHTLIFFPSEIARLLGVLGSNKNEEKKQRKRTADVCLKQINKYHAHTLAICTNALKTKQIQCKCKC